MAKPHPSGVLFALFIHSSAEYASILSGCPLRVPPKTWPAAAAYDAANFDALHVSSYGRWPATPGSLRLDGLCSAGATGNFYSKDYFYGGGGNSWMANRIDDGVASLRFGTSHCNLQGVSVRRVTSSEFELRLQYGACAATAHVFGKPPSSRTHAAVTFRIRNASLCESNLVQWMCAISSDSYYSACHPPDRTTTTLSPGELSLDVHEKWKKIGIGRCNSLGFIVDTMPAPTKGGPATWTQCLDRCTDSIADFTLSRHNRDSRRCRGFAFALNVVPYKSRCILYMSLALDIMETDIDDTPEKWACWSVKADNSSSKRSFPTSPEPKSHEQSLHLFGSGAVIATSAFLRRLRPPKQAPDCYEGVDWYTLEGANGDPATVCIRSEEWATFDAMVPSIDLGPADAKAPGAVSIARVCVEGCGLGACALQGTVSVSGGVSMPVFYLFPLTALVTAALTAGLMWYYLPGVLRKPPQKTYKLIMHEFEDGEQKPASIQELVPYQKPSKSVQLQEGTLYTWNHR